MPRTHSRTRLLSTLVLTAASAMLASTTMTFTAHAAPSPRGEDKVKVLDWLAVEQSNSKPHDVRIGDDWTVHAHLHSFREHRRGKKIGDASAHCSAVDVTPHGYTALCQRVLRTDAGSISLSDSIDRSGPHSDGGLSQITGGTGKYVDAEGQAEVTMHGDATRFRISLDD